MLLSPLAFEVAAVVLGLLFGSFLNVCIGRLPRHESIVRPGSHCPRCGHAIRWYDNVPLLSWLILGGKCRDCNARISWSYPAVELAVAVWFWYASRLILAVIVYHSTSDFGPKPDLAFDVNHGLQIAATLILGYLLIGLMVMDWQTHTLPDAFTLTGTAIGFALTCVHALFLAPHEADVILHGRNPINSAGAGRDTGNVILTGPEAVVLARLGAILAAAGAVLLIRWAYRKLRGREGLGLGDAKLMAMIAALLGLAPAALAAFVGVILCSVYAVALLARGKASAATRLPLGSFLAVGGLVAAIFGPPLLAWYSSLF